MINKNNFRSALNVIFSISLVSIVSITNADDTDVFLTNKSKPNLLFVMDMSGSMNWGIDANGYNPLTGETDEGSPPSRASVMKDAVHKLLEEAPDEINIGLMSYGPGTFEGSASRLAWPESYRSHGVHGVAFPVKGINELASPIIDPNADIDNLPNPSSTVVVRKYLSDVVNTWEPKGGTPIVDSLVEASRYFAGDRVIFGQDVPSSIRGAHPSTHEGNAITRNLNYSPRNPYATPNYETPITDGCQENYIALLSDGDPTNYYLNQTRLVRSGRYYYRVVTPEWGKGPGPFASYMKGNGVYGTLAAGVGNCETSPSGFKAGQCGPEVAQYMATQDMNLSIEGEQNVKVFTVGYGKSINENTKNFLKSLVTVDDNPDTTEKEGYYTAANGESLSKAFSNIVSAVTETAFTLGSPSYSVNVQNGLEHEGETYIPLFSKDSGVRWSGNLKKFKLANTAQGSSEVKVLKGKNNKAAFDEMGLFKPDALDYWSDSSEDNPDGSDMRKGGVAGKLNPANRNLFTDISCSVTPCGLNTKDNLLVPDNVKLTSQLFGLGNNNFDRELLVNFIRGKNPNGTTRYHLGDMLHSEPVIITYNSGSDETDKEQYIFVGTNEGYLHAFNTVTGEEKFAYMPKEFLKNIAPQYSNLDGHHLYGIDGKISHWQDKKTKKRYLYFGLRRGGTSFYALDITDISDPKLLWKKSAADYPTMGQSWSAPYLDRIGYGEGGIKKEAVIISAGYDPIEDRKDSEGFLDKNNPATNVETSVGKDILILDAKTGQKLWSLSDAIGGSAVEDSIPGGLKILDTNFNGLVDRIYFADTGGNVWRLDLSEAIGSTSGKSTLTKLASLAGSGETARKFYSEPEVAVLKHKGKVLFAISIGSGYRAHPLNKVIDDKFFILVDDTPFKVPDESFTTIKINNLSQIDITESGGVVSLETTGSFYEDGKRGWVVSFPQTGEKVLTNAITRNGSVMFTTFVPETDHVACGTPTESISRLYAINVVTGKAGINFEKPLDRKTLDTPLYAGGGNSSPIVPGPGYPGIVPPPESVFGSFEIDDDGTCKHPVDYRWGRKASPVSGYSACSLESAYWSDPVTD